MSLIDVLQSYRYCLSLSFPLSFEPVFLDHISRFLTDHESHRIGVPGWYDGHDGSVDHPEAFDSAYPEFRVYYRIRVRFRTHLASARLVV